MVYLLDQKKEIGSTVVFFLSEDVRLIYETLSVYEVNGIGKSIHADLEVFAV